MRLLKYVNTSEFVFTEDFADKDQIPPYAILSHTWSDGEEVAFDELINATGKSKAGYEKIYLCGQQAQRDGLQYFWVDTCCINKSDHVELRKAINSMFRWYQNAAKCYVYLSDVSSLKRKSSDEASDLSWESAFQNSRWFTRGWTLQELLAPASVEFFSREWKRLGDKLSLKTQIHKVTGISESALEGASLFQFSVNERLLWKEGRHTKLEEDRAYSLLGIFGVYVTPIYGEGVREAFRRLLDEISRSERCTQDLHLTDPRDDKKRIEETKGGLVEGSYRWILENHEFQQWRSGHEGRMLWIKGDPGKGKTMLLCGIVDELKNSTDSTHLLSYFFFQATDSRINNATAVLRGLLYMLVVQQPSLISHIRSKYDHAGKSLFEDANSWVALCEIFTSILKDANLKSAYFIIDALDECIEDRTRLLDFIVHESTASSCIKWIVSSRNWPEIEEQLRKAGRKLNLSLELNAQSIATAVRTFIQHKVLHLAKQKNYDNKTRDTVLNHLFSNANDTFLWVALVCQNLEGVSKRNAVKKLSAFPPGLDYLYERMLQQINRSDDADVCKQTLALVSILYRPITFQELVTISGHLEYITDDLESIKEIISLCGSFLTIQGETIYFVHQSAKDFLFTKAFDEIFPFGKEQVHWDVFSRSLKFIARSLHRDIYGLVELGYPSEKIKQPTPDPLAALCYSCIYWIDHLCDSDSGFPSSDIEEFLSTKYVYWLEALSLCRSVSKGVVSVAKILALAQKKENSSFLTELAQDAYRFIMYHKVAIEESPLQVYVSALLFSPRCSLIKSLFEKEKPFWVKITPSITDSWSPCLQTLEGHSGAISSVNLSLDSKWLASSSYDHTIKIWDLVSGNCLHTLKGHTDLVSSAVFSPDSKVLASSSYDNTIKIWDPANATCLKTLKGHSGWVNSVVFSHDSNWLASASHDKTVIIWDTINWVYLKMLKGHGGAVNFVVFSHDSKRLVSASRDKTVKIWDSIEGNCLQTLDGHSDLVSSAAFSPDSKVLASSSYDNTIKIWDPANATCLKTLKGHSGWVNFVVFSPDSKWLASASDDKTSRIWDWKRGTCSQVLHGHGAAISSVAFLPETKWLISGSYDNMVKIWETTGNSRLQNTRGHSDWISFMTFSPDLRWLASASRDRTVKIWELTSGSCSQTLEGHVDMVSSVVFSPDLKSLASASNDKTIKTWNPISGVCLQTLKGHDSWIYSVAFSYDSKRLASSSYDHTIKIWDLVSGNCLHTLKGHTDLVSSAVFSPDSKVLASSSYDNTIKIWDPANATCLKTLKGHSGWVNSVVFSHDSKRLASASNDNTIKMWDLKSTECVYVFDTEKPLLNISFSTCGSFLHTEIGPIAIGSSADSNTTADTELQDAAHQSIALSLDRVWITRNSKNLLRLPSEYRPSCLALSGNMVGIGVGSGEVWVFQFGF